MTPTSTLTSEKASTRFSSNTLASEKKQKKEKPFFPKDIRPGTLIVVE